ncbi:MAG: hypothetical protein JXR68_04035 [Bacteroidales bacterium]|nr:hypothetical protein [Bacteroidales bacterium]
MNKLLLIIFLALMFTFSCTFDEKTNEFESENVTGWNYRKNNQDKWKRAIIPESVQEAAKRDTLIQTLFYRNTFALNRWTDTVSWEYSANIKIAGDPKKYNYQLYFERITGIAEVYLNDSLLFVANNTFKSWEIDVSDILKRGKNKLFVKFLPLKDAKAIVRQNASFKLPAKGYENLRLPNYFIDTTKGIYYVPLGITGNVSMQSWKRANIENVYFQIKKLHYDEEAVINVTYKILAKNNTNIDLQIFNESEIIINKSINLKKGENILNYSFKIENPVLWWTHDTGEPFLYKFTTKILYNDEIVQQVSNNYGLRDLSVDTTNNKFNLFLNGQLINLKIINYLPIDIFLNGLTTVSYQNAIKDFVQSGVNMVHVDENGIYEKNIFYNECDKNGVLVWQDFMLPYKIFDTTGNFIQNITQEATQNVIRLRNHPCLAFWSGQNSFTHYYNMYKHACGYNSADSLFFLQNNNLIFGRILKNIVEKYDSSRTYFEHIDYSCMDKIENILPSFPNILAIRKFTSQGDRTLDAKIYRYYFRPSSADSVIKSMIHKNNLNIIDFSAYVYASQFITVAEYEKKIVELRINSTKNAVIVGQYKDYTPVISNSLVDYNGYWKGQMYALKRNMQNILVKMNEVNGDVNFDILSDLKENINVDIYLKLYNFDGKVYWRKNMINTTIYGQNMKEYFSFNLSRELNQIGRKQAVLKVDVFYNQELYYEKYFLFVEDRNLNLKPPNIKVKYFTVDDGYVIELTTNYFARHVYVFTEKDGRFSDNFVNLAPGETKKIYFYTPNDIYAIEGAFKVIDYTQVSSLNLFTF